MKKIGIGDVFQEIFRNHTSLNGIGYKKTFTNYQSMKVVGKDFAVKYRFRA